MARSNNQRRRIAKNTGKVFIPAWTKSKTKQRANRERVKAEVGGAKAGKKLAYRKMVNKSGKVVDRKFRRGGYNNSGKNGSAGAIKTAKKANAKRNKAKGQ
jgi:hypothetical protein